MRALSLLVLLCNLSVVSAQPGTSPNISGITLATYNHDEMRDFYQSVFSIHFRSEKSEGYVLYTGKLGEVDLQLCPAELAGNNTEQNRHQLTIAVNNLNETIRRVNRHSGQTTSDVAMYEGKLMVSITDPDDNSLVLIQKSMISDRAYFKASGTEPFWTLEINEEMIRFTSLLEGLALFTTPHVEPDRAQDANVKMYRADVESGQIRIQIKQEPCTNAMSGEQSPYRVDVSIRRGIDKDFTMVTGCGEYLPDYRLQDIWVLESIRNVPIQENDFMREIPRIEINTGEGKFSGYAGCNRMNGTLFSENKLLRFTDIITTRMACPGENKESAFLNALQSVTSFDIRDNRLYLSNPNGNLLTFKKSD